MDAAGVAVGSAVRVASAVGIGDEVAVALSMTGIGVDCPQAVRKKATVIRICQNTFFMLNFRRFVDLCK